MNHFKVIVFALFSFLMTEMLVYAQKPTSNPNINSSERSLFPRPPRPRPRKPAKLVFTGFQQEGKIILNRENQIRVPVEIKVRNIGQKTYTHNFTTKVSIIANDGSREEVDLSWSSYYMTIRRLQARRTKTFTPELILPKSYEGKTIRLEAHRSRSNTKSDVLTLRIPQFKPDLVVVGIQKTSLKRLPNGNFEVGLKSVVKNQGNVHSKAFSMGARMYTSNNNFPVNYKQGRSGQVYSHSLDVGATNTLIGTVIVESEIIPTNNISLQTIADYCTGNGNCTVEESNENNNGSLKLGVTLPQTGPPNSPVN